MVKISRRDFLKGSGATALSLMAAGLVGCSTENEKTPEVTTPAPSVENDKIATAYLNIQRDDYRTHTKELKTLFSPLTVGSLQLSHRMVKSAAGSATYLAGLTDELLQYYVNFAKGGVEMIYVEGITALEIPADGSPGFRQKAGRRMCEIRSQPGLSVGTVWCWGKRDDCRTDSGD